MANEQIYINKLKTEIESIKANLKDTDKDWYDRRFDDEKESVYSVITQEVFEIENYYNSDTKTQLFENLDKITQRYPAQSKVRSAFLTSVYRLYDHFHSETLISSPAFQKVTDEVAQKYKNGDFEHISRTIPFKLLPHIYPINKYKSQEDFLKDLYKLKEIVLNDTLENNYLYQNPYDEINEHNINSRAILGEIGDTFKYNPKNSLYDKNIFKVLAGGLEFASSLTEREQRLWSEIAGKIKDEYFIKALTNTLDAHYSYDSFSKSRMLMTMLFSNETAQKQQEQFLKGDTLDYEEIAYALTKTPHITPLIKDVLERNIGPKFTEAYLENKNKIDHTPRKDLLYDILGDYTSESDFFTKLTERLKDIAQEPQFAGHREWSCLGDALEKNGPEFHVRAMQELQNMLKEQSNRDEINIPERGARRNNNAFFRKNFPELVEAYHQHNHLSSEKIDNAIDYCNRVHTIKRTLLRNVKDKSLDGRLIEDIARLGNVNAEHAMRIIDLFYNANPRPETYGSFYNSFYPAQIAPIVKRDFPEWMNPSILKAVKYGVIKNDRLGSEKNLFDACKTWEINPYIWKKEAEVIGRMPLKSRIVACGIYSQMMDAEKNAAGAKYRAKPLDKSQKEQFWHTFKQAQEMGMDKALEIFARDSTPNRHRALTLLNNKRISQHETDTLIRFLSVGNISGCKINHFQRAVNTLMDIKWKEDRHDGRISQIYRKNIKELEDPTKTYYDYFPVEVEGKEYDLRKFYIENRENILPSALALSRVFGSAFPNYLKKVLPYTNIHDATYWMPKNMTPEQNQEFSKFLMREVIYPDTNGMKHIRPFSELQIIGKNWSSLQSEEKKLSYKGLLAICTSKKYSNQKYLNFASEAAKHGISEDDYKYYENIYAAGLLTPAPFETGVSFKCKDLVGRFLPRSDERVGFFGEYTGCCQHFSHEAAGEQCAISSVKDPFSQLFVVENDEGNIIAGSWVWTNKNSYADKDGNKKMYKTCTFDNIEGSLSYSDRGDDILDIYRQVGTYLTQRDYRQITIGMSFSDVDLSGFEHVPSIPLNSMYSGYSDSNSQVLLAENTDAKPLDEKASELYITGACQNDNYAMEDVARKCFPEDAQSLAMPTYDPSAMLLRDQGKVVGYIIWSENKDNMEQDGNKTSNWIYDMAVLPDYRGQKGGDTRGEGSLLLLNAMMKHVKEVGGEWGAELRDKTTLKYMMMMSDKVKNGEIAGISPNFEGRCLIDLEILSHDHSMGDGSNVYAVKFNVLNKEEREKRLKMRLERGNSTLSPQIINKSQDCRG